jgi:hypothetical protein
LSCNTKGGDSTLLILLRGDDMLIERLQMLLIVVIFFAVPLGVVFLNIWIEENPYNEKK